MRDWNNVDQTVEKQDIADIFRIVAERGTADRPIGDTKVFILDDISTQENSTFRIISIGEDSLTETRNSGLTYYRGGMHPGKLHETAEKLRAVPKNGGLKAGR